MRKWHWGPRDPRPLQRPQAVYTENNETRRYAPDVVTRADFTVRAMANQQRWNALHSRPPRPVLQIVSMEPCWVYMDEFGQAYRCSDPEGREICTVSQQPGGIWWCFACQCGCCGHIVEVLLFTQGKNEIDG